MRLFSRAFSSARSRLILWNTITFAVVLVSLGLAFRVLAERSLLTALDREMKVQAGRFRDTQMIQIVMVGARAPKTTLNISMATGVRHELRLSESRSTARYRFVRKIGAPAPDASGQFLYRSFGLDGKPLSPIAPHLPFGVPLPGEEFPNNGIAQLISKHGTPEVSRPADYQPWDRPSFTMAARGKEVYGDVEAGGVRMRLLSVPLLRDAEIVGVAQIAAPLGQVYRDIAGLTRTLLLVLPLALLVAAIAGVFLTDRALRPVKEMTRSAAGIRPDQLSQRLPITGADEFDELASTFNCALERVETAFQDRERAIAQLRRFTADASHELRTPLTTIKTNAGVALSESEPSVEHIHALRQIDRAANRMTALVQDLLLLARSDAGQLALEAIPVSLAEVISEAIDSLPPSAHAPIVVEPCDAELTVRGDFEHLRRLFVNLLQNSVLHTPEDGRITVAIDTRDGRACVTVADTGCGIAPEHLGQIGQPFYRADVGRNRRLGGAGLGLAICGSIAAAHRATLNIDSAPGCGTRITLSFGDGAG